MVYIVTAHAPQAQRCVASDRHHVTHNSIASCLQRALTIQRTGDNLGMIESRECVCREHYLPSYS